MAAFFYVFRRSLLNNSTGRCNATLPCLGKVAELVGAAVFLASEATRFVNAEGLVVDRGFLAGDVNQQATSTRKRFVTSPRP